MFGRSWFAIFCLLCVPLSAQDPAAVVRVTAGNALGSGTVIYRSENGDAYVLTNFHVAGRKGSRVGIEFWQNGILVPRVPGVVVAGAKDTAFTDVSIVRISKSDLGELDPPYIPLAKQGTVIGIDDVVQSRGCPGGVWACQFIGHAKSSDKNRVEFWPRPGGGRSGSSVLVKDKNEVAGLLTWSADIPQYESHNSDGSGYKSGFGIAQQVDSIWGVIRGNNTSSGPDLPEHYAPLIDYVFDPQETQEEIDEAARNYDRLRRFLKRFRGIELPPAPGQTPEPTPPLPDMSEPFGEQGQQEPPPVPNDPRSLYAREMEQHAQDWATFEASDDNRWTDYASAYARSQESQRPILVLLSLPGCQACDILKAKLKAADKDGWLNNTETCIIDSVKEPQLAAKFAPPAYPTLILSKWDDQGKLTIQASHVGDFPLESKKGVMGTILAPTLEEWFVLHEVQ